MATICAIKQCLLLALVILAIQAKVTLKDGKFFDQQGREIIFHGANVVVKTPPYIPVLDKYNPSNSFTRQDARQLKEWGFNGIRLGVMWAGVETKEAVYNQTYLNKMLEIVNMAAEFGIYTLVEFHQDLASQKFCGDGIPAWLLKNKLTSTFPAPLSKHYTYEEQTGLPNWQDCAKHPWGTYYFTYDVSYTMQALYTNQFNLRDKFVKYWVKVAETFRDNPYVIAYELINEPFAGAIFKNPLLLVPSMVERLRLQHFYDLLSVAIREKDPSHPLCFEPVTWDNTVPAGFSHPPGGNKYRNQSVFCYHYYSPPALNVSSITTRVLDAQKMGISSLVSEFWYQGRDKDIDQIDAFNKHDQSWFFWAYKHFGNSRIDAHRFKLMSDSQPKYLLSQDGSLNQDHIQVLSQTYVQRLSGELAVSNYNSATKEYYISFYTRKAAETVLYLNRQVNYPTGFSIDIFPKNSLQYVQREPNYHYFSSVAVPDGTRVLISIKRL